MLSPIIPAPMTITFFIVKSKITILLNIITIFPEIIFYYYKNQVEGGRNARRRTS